MFRFPCNNRGFTLVEVVIALFITTIAVFSIFSLMAPAWRTTTLSDYTGRAANILYDQLQQQEARIMNPCNNVDEVSADDAEPVTVYASGNTERVTFPSGADGAALSSGDAAFEVTTTVAQIATNVWRVTVSVAWTGHSAISDSIDVTRQDNYRFPNKCAIL